VLVTDGEQRAALAAVRSLGRAGYRVLVASRAGRSLAGASRRASLELVAGDPLYEPAAFADRIAAAVDDHSVEVLLPVGDAALLAVLGHRERLGRCVVPFPPLERVRQVADKQLVAAAAAELGIAIPRQEVLGTIRDAEAADRRPLAFPLVVKPARSVADAGDGTRAKYTVRYAQDPAALAGALQTLPPHAYPLLLQQRVVGPGVGIFLLLWDGQVVASFAHRRIREKPPSGGVSVYRESIEADPDLVARSRALLERFGWCGVAMIEYKLDAATRTPYLMEINGRFWGSLQLAIDAGVDFPALLVSLAMGERPAPVSSYRLGVRSRWWLGDVDQLLARLRRSPAELALPPGSPSRLAALREFLTLWRPGDRSEILRLDDPAPAFRELADWIRGR
jgi:predicted ATP-grasp superfamily ATP-dependent carboligase